MTSVEDLTREYQARLNAAAQAQYRNEDLVAYWFDEIEGSLGRQSKVDYRRFAGRLVEWARQQEKHLLTFGGKEAHAYVKWVEEGRYPNRASAEPEAPAPSVVLSHIIIANVIFDHLREERGLALKNPFAEVYRSYKLRHRAEMKPELRALKEREVRQALEGAETVDDMADNLILVKTGMRREEYVTIQEPQVNWKQRFITLAAHAKRTYLKAYFDEEAEYFLRLKVARNHRLYPGSRWLSPSPYKPGQHISPETLARRLKSMIQRSPLGATIADWKDPLQKVTEHTWRRSFTSIMKTRGCPPHVVAALRGDSLRSKTELTPHPTQGIYTYFGEIEEKDELRYWYDKCMPDFGAREIWERLTPEPVDAKSVQELVRAVRRSKA